MVFQLTVPSLYVSDGPCKQASGIQLGGVGGLAVEKKQMEEVVKCSSLILFSL